MGDFSPLFGLTMSQRQRAQGPAVPRALKWAVFKTISQRWHPGLNPPSLIRGLVRDPGKQMPSLATTRLGLYRSPLPHLAGEMVRPVVLSGPTEGTHLRPVPGGGLAPSPSTRPGLSTLGSYSGVTTKVSPGNKVKS